MLKTSFHTTQQVMRSHLPLINSHVGKILQVDHLFASQSYICNPSRFVLSDREKCEREGPGINQSGFNYFPPRILS